MTEPAGEPITDEQLAEIRRLTGRVFHEPEPEEAKMVDNHRLDHLYTHPFHDGAGKYFTVVSKDDNGIPDVIDAEHPRPLRNKIKTRLTFIKSDEGGYIKEIELKKFKYYAQGGYVEQECMTFSFPFFTGLIGFLQSFAGLNLNDITERRIPLAEEPELDDETKRQFQTLAATQQGQELIREAVKSGRITGADIVNIGYRKAQLERFERMMEAQEAIDEYRAEFAVLKAGNEAVWQDFFEANTWIFGYGLKFIFNEPLEGEKLELTIRGHDIAGAGKRADAVLKSSGVVSSLCLVEIKTPQTSLLEDQPYRAECWQSSKELSGGIAQSQKTAQKTLENIALSPEFRATDEEGNPTGEVVYSYRPKAFLIIGTLAEFTTETGTNREKFASFELLRRNTLEPEIITFDELLARAKFIVSDS